MLGALQVVKKRKLLHTQNLMQQPAVPGNMGSSLQGLWNIATAISAESRAEAVRTAKRKAAEAKSAAKSKKAQLAAAEQEVLDEDEVGQPASIQKLHFHPNLIGLD